MRNLRKRLLSSSFINQLNEVYNIIELGFDAYNECYRDIISDKI